MQPIENFVPQTNDKRGGVTHEHEIFGLAENTLIYNDDYKTKKVTAEMGHTNSD